MLLYIEDWVFEIDLEKTKKHSLLEASENCQCAYCRNFYRGLDSAYQGLKSKLLSFGICAEAPEKMNPTVFSEEQILYDPMYYVFGRIVQKGTGPFLAGFVSVYPSDQGEMLDGSAVFRLQAKGVNCPWRLEEPFTGVICADQDNWFSATLQ
jgi:hypothetical protein